MDVKGVNGGGRGKKTGRRAEKTEGEENECGKEEERERMVGESKEKSQISNRVLNYIHRNALSTTCISSYLCLLVISSV